MKKLRNLLLILTAMLMVLAIPFSAACKKNKPEPEPGPGPDPVVTTTLQSITINTDNVKKDYYYDEEFSASGLVVTANYKKSDSETLINETVTDYSVDSSAYDKKHGGEYTIVVSYTYENVTKEADYNVTVTEYGLSVTVADDVDTEFVLSSETTTASLANVISALEVKKSDVKGNVLGSVLTSSEYTVTVYNKTEEVEADDYSKLSGGVYQVWAQLNTENGAYAPKGFVLVYVIDPIESLSLNEGATLTQVAGNDEISSTWTFTATYATGATKQLTIADVTVEGLDTKTVAANATATVTYTDINAKGEEVAKTVEVNYTITQKPTSGGAVANQLLAVDAETWSYTADTDLTQADFTGDKAFLTVLGGTVKYRPGQSKGCIEIKGDALQFTVEGSCTLKLELYSTGGSNVSDIAVKDSTGKYMESTTPEAVADTAAEGYYVVTGTSNLTVLEFELEAGTYTITACCDSTTGAVHNRNTRIKTVQITGHASEVAVQNRNIEIDAETWSYTADTDLTQADFTGDLSFLTVLDGTVKYRPGQSKGCIEIKGDALQFTVEGSCTLKLSLYSTGGSNVSDIAVKDSNGNYVLSKTEGAVADTAAEGYYVVTGTSNLTVLEFELKAGTYTITACCDSTTGAVHNRNTRLKAIQIIGNTSVTASNFSLAIDAETWAYEADTNLTQADFTGELDFLTVLDGTVKYRPGQSKGCIELKGDALQFTVTGSGTLRLELYSTGGSNYSDIAVKDSNGNYLVTTTEGAVADTDGEGYYIVYGTSSLTILEFELEAGTYTITACCDSTDGAVHNRNTRLKNISFVAD